MKKTIWSLAALMFMTAPMMTSCSNDLDEVQTEQAKGNIVTLTIAPPVNVAETRVTVDGSTFNITGWELDDEVNLYIITTTVRTNQVGFKSEGVVTFKCIDATRGTFIGTLPEGKTLEDYNFAVFGATAKKYDTTNLSLVQKTMCSTELKDVVMMAAWKSDAGTYNMEVVNNVMKVKNNTGSAMEVAWYGISYGGGDPYFFTPCVLCSFEYDRRTEEISKTWGGLTISHRVKPEGNEWDKASHFTLQSGMDSYINMGIMGHSGDQWSIAKEDGTIVVAMKGVGTRGRKRGKLYNAGSIN